MSELSSSKPSSLTIREKTTTVCLFFRSMLLRKIEKNWIKRLIFGLILSFGFTLVVYMGPIAMLLSVLVIQVFCFNEIIIIGYNYNKVPLGLPHFRSLCWYFLISANYFLYGETLVHHFQDFVNKWYYLRALVMYHRFFSFCFYFLGIIFFVLSIVRKHDLKQFRILAWTHTILIIVVLQSYMIIQNLFHGMIWFILPVSLVVINDIFAYVFGRMLGKTPLIKLSPNKTWEGFIGGGISTIISGFIFSNIMCKYKYFVCPADYIYNNLTKTNFIELNTDCNPNDIFLLKEYQLISMISVKLYPFIFHSFAFSLFASIIAPFGGFYASGFKRAFKIKDFSNVIPGHGGIMDRTDCQFLMALFVNVYIFSFIRNSTLDMLFQKILYLNEDNQLQFYFMLENMLKTKGLIVYNNSIENVTFI